MILAMGSSYFVIFVTTFGIPIIGMCAFAITFLARFTDGPFDVFARLRRLIKLELPMYNQLQGEEMKIVGWFIDDDPEGFFAKLANCFWCSTTWWAVPFILAYIPIAHGSWLLAPFLWIASVGMSGLMFEIMIKDTNNA